MEQELKADGFINVLCSSQVLSLPAHKQDLSFFTFHSLSSGEADLCRCPHRGVWILRFDFL